VFQGESWMSDPANWRRRNAIAPTPRVGADAVTKLRAIVSRLSDPTRVCRRRPPILATGDHRCRHRDRHASQPPMTEPVPSAIRLTRNAEHYYRSRRPQPVHVSEIAPSAAYPAAAFIARSTSARHRSGHVPATQAAMRYSFQRFVTCDPATTTIGEIALQHGFLNLEGFPATPRACSTNIRPRTFGKRYPGRGRPRLAEPAAI
jgi:AraC family ethanolamine operon transcriptional activator